MLEDIRPTPEELYLDMRKDLLAGAVIEVLLSAGEASHGVRRLWKADAGTKRPPPRKPASAR